MPDLHFRVLRQPQLSLWDVFQREAAVIRSHDFTLQAARHWRCSWGTGSRRISISSRKVQISSRCARGWTVFRDSLYATRMRGPFML
ncbi:hypothetical protein A3A67_04595 [Candidatus Peribacteria bacterium RIFCSPLOWO2_01_FULL_51_18]|nr:MAG: hypothetical protein A3C52_03260 [Candidatus Peribacteria bacterium RIFCSPHIGHO2_02_FULL_51_15]OGJ66685.1 MAG: hypothetical protein A3A67_04595 [Candidatus Peribacteria bacterium RIFCSPLOWO2_01_FULL_51_18]OGJ69789.1 MAG: hypothetical protein A3J34_04915 [Candidatus Peribacteria bacterium RIFCSPLOWO2_02_FULL_51_10]